MTFRKLTQSSSARLFLILILTVILRLAVLNWIGQARVSWQYEYEEIADNLRQYGRYAYSFYGLTAPQPSSFLPPVYPLFLVFTRSLFSSPDYIAKLIQIFLAIPTVLCIYAITREVGGSEDHAVLSALLAALYPPFIFYSVDLTTAALEMFFGLLGIWLVIRMTRMGSVKLAFVAGLGLSLATLTRPTWLSLLPLALLWSLWYRRGQWPVWLAFSLAGTIVFAPWVAYNYQTHGIWLLTSTNGGLNFWIGNNAHATGEYVVPTELDSQLVASVAAWPEASRDQFFYQQGWEFIRASPQEFIKLSARKLSYYLFFRPNIGSNYAEANIGVLSLVRWGFVIAWLALQPLAIIGLTQWREHWREHLWLVSIWVIQAGLTTLYFTGTRFRVPFDALVIIWAAAGILVLVHPNSSYGSE